MVTDNELLSSYASKGSDAAFSQLVHRHINLVYAAAVRELRGNTSLAEDLCQSVFLELARKAPGLCRHPALAGWLYTCVRRTASNLRRAEERRGRREHQSHAMNEILKSESSDSSWQEIKPVLDDAMHELSEKDRAAVVLRFFEQRTIEQVGLALGLKKGAAHMRIDRALEKLRVLLSKRGVTATTSGLTAGLVAGASVVAPQGLAASVAASVTLSAATCGSAALALNITKIITMTKIKTGIAAAMLVAGVTTPLVWQHQAGTRLQLENQSLRNQLEEQATLREDNQQLLNRLASISAKPLGEKERSELLKLRGEVTTLRKENLEQKAALASKPKTLANPVKKAQPLETEDRKMLLNAELNQAMDLHRAALDRQMVQLGNGSVINGSVTVVLDDAGNQHLMQFTDGEWKEIEIGDKYVTTPEEAVAMRGNVRTNSNNGGQTHYSVVTNSPSASP